MLMWWISAHTLVFKLQAPASEQGTLLRNAGVDGGLGPSLGAWVIILHREASVSTSRPDTRLEIKSHMTGSAVCVSTVHTHV